MPEPVSSGSQTASQIRACLHDLAEVLREAHHLEPEAQQALADLVDELQAALEPTAVPPAELAHLAESAAHLARALRQRHDAGLLAAARERLEQAAVRAETAAPLATGLARRFMETLANLGI
jgi:hypothetical protein